MTQATTDKPYHHGNLRRALVDAGLTLLAERGLKGLSLRACATRAGVSHASPAHHFAGLPGLQTAIAARGHQIFAQVMREFRARAQQTPKERIEAIMRGYLAFAREHPDLFALMFNARLTFVSDPEFEDAAADSFGILRETCAAFLPTGESPFSTEVMIWSLIHGFASLELSGRLNRPLGGQPAPDLSDLLPLLTPRAGL